MEDSVPTIEVKREEEEVEEAHEEEEQPKQQQQQQQQQIKPRTGKWTTEEFEYMLGLMEAFKVGHLPLQDGTTLRSFLSKMMRCKPKRISKKFEGIRYNG